MGEWAMAVLVLGFSDRAVTEDLVPGYPAALPGCFNIGVLLTSLAGSADHGTYAPPAWIGWWLPGMTIWRLAISMPGEPVDADHQSVLQICRRSFHPPPAPAGAGAAQPAGVDAGVYDAVNRCGTEMAMAGRNVSCSPLTA